jgi:PQQ-dependent catabolism-associated CXXCW motif protein
MWGGIRVAHRAISCLAGLLFVAGTAIAADAPEPETYWTGPMQGDVPATLAKGHVIHAQALAELIAANRPVLVDVAERPHRPAGLPSETIWKPAPHRDIAGSVWLPGVGSGAPEPTVAQAYEARLAALTKGDFDRAIVLYCHARCWGSWNAAKRAISLGYRQVYWYPDGVEGWQEAGHDLSIVADDGATAPSQ